MPAIAVVTVVPAVAVLAVTVVVRAGAAVSELAAIVLVVSAVNDADAVVTLEPERTVRGPEHTAVEALDVHPAIGVLDVVVIPVIHPAVAVVAVVVSVVVIALPACPGSRATIRDAGDRHPDLRQVVEVEAGARA